MKSYSSEIRKDDVDRVSHNSILTYSQAEHRSKVYGFVKFQGITMEMIDLLDYRFLVVSFSIGSKNYIGQVDIQCGEFRKLFSLKPESHLKEKIFGANGNIMLNQRLYDLVHVIDHDHGQEQIMRTSKLCRFLLDPFAKGDQLTRDLNLKGYFLGLELVHSYAGGWEFHIQQSKEEKDTKKPAVVVSFTSVMSNCINGVRNDYKIDDMNTHQQIKYNISKPVVRESKVHQFPLPIKESQIKRERDVSYSKC